MTLSSLLRKGVFSTEDLEEYIKCLNQLQAYEDFLPHFYARSLYHGIRKYL